MTTLLKPVLCVTALLSLAWTAPDRPADARLSVLFGQVGLSPEQRADVEAGRPVAKVLPWGGPSEVHVFGAIRIDGAPETYLKMSRSVSRLARTPGYLAIGELSPTIDTADLSGLSLDPDDIKALKKCREGDCDVQLPTASITAFHDAVDWSQPDASAQVNGLARGMVLQLVREYRRGGNTALGVYRDKQHPARVAEQFETMVGRSSVLPADLPELRRYLLNYPDVDLPASDSFFYWEKVDFGMKPTIRVNHGVVYRGGDQGVSAVAIKQLYASHYFHTALDVSVCVPDEGRPDHRGFYLITLKSSEQDGLTGAKGSILRKVVVDKTRSSFEKALASIKQTIENTATRKGK